MTRVPPSIAGLLGVIHGLHICWTINQRKVEINTNSVEVVNMLMRGCANDFPYKELVDDACGLIMREWEVSIRHVSREAYDRVDHLAKLGHTIAENFLFLRSHPMYLDRHRLLAVLV